MGSSNNVESLYTLDRSRALLLRIDNHKVETLHVYSIFYLNPTYGMKRLREIRTPFVCSEQWQE